MPRADEARLKQHILGRIKWFSQERFVLRHGQWFRTDVRTTSGRRMTRKQCYCNSALCALDHPTLRYCEGFCYDCSLNHLFEHAWLIDERGIVVDPTLRDTPLAYFGVPFQTEYLRETMQRTRVYGIFIPQNREVYSLDDAHLACIIDPVFGTTIKRTSRKGRRPVVD
jgi:hypothetical protein